MSKKKEEKRKDSPLSKEEKKKRDGSYTIHQKYPHTCTS
jgi:hypothetical protein